MKISKLHPRYLSLTYREKIVDGVKRNLTSLAGLTAHGRGEAFDYLLGETTLDFAKSAIDAASAYLILAKFPVICVNGNTAALSGEELVKLANILNAPIEINLFHKSKRREVAIENYLKTLGAKEILKPDGEEISGIHSNRRMISSQGQQKADLIFVPLEDGDRTEELKKMGKTVITVDLNPLSRTAKSASVTIVDLISRCLPLLIQQVESFRNKDPEFLSKLVSEYNNEAILKSALLHINNRLITLSK